MSLIIFSLISYGSGFYQVALIGQEKPCSGDIEHYYVELSWIESGFVSQMGINDVTDWSFSGAQRISGGTNGFAYVNLKINNDTLVTISCKVKKNSAGNYPYFNETVTLRIHPYCLRGLSPETISGNTYVNKYDISQQTYSINTLKYLNGDNVDSYGWVIPSGWSYSGIISNGSTPFIINSSSITVIPNNCTGGNVTVYGISKCGGSTSNTVSRFVSRTFNNYSITGSPLVCSFGSTFTINNLPPFNSIVWTPGQNLSISSQNGSNCTFIATGNGTSTINAKVYTDCGEISIPTLNVWVGLPPTPEISSYTPFVWATNYWPTPVKVFTVYTGEEIDFYDENDNTYGGLIQGFNREWSIEAGGISYDAYDYGPGGRMCFFHQPGSVRIRAKLSNFCDETDWSEPVFVEVVEQEYLLSLSPNPVSGEATVEIKGSTQTQSINKNGWNLEIYDQGQALKTKIGNIKSKSIKIETSGWKDGVYVVRANIGKEIISQKLVIKH